MRSQRPWRVLAACAILITGIFGLSGLADASYASGSSNSGTSGNGYGCLYYKGHSYHFTGPTHTNSIGAESGARQTNCTTPSTVDWTNVSGSIYGGFTTTPYALCLSFGQVWDYYGYAQWSFDSTYTPCDGWDAYYAVASDHNAYFSGNQINHVNGSPWAYMTFG